MTELQAPLAIAFLHMIAWSEGTSREGRDPYRVTYGYKHTLRDLSDHPAITGEWLGLALPPSFCRRAGLRAGCKSTAAGAYQITKPTWLDRALRQRYRPASFEPAEQDRFCWFALIADAGAQELVLRGQITAAIDRCSHRWASLPGSNSGQPERKLQGLLDTYQDALRRIAP